MKLRLDRINGDLFRRLWVRIPAGSEIFSLFPCGPISLLGFSLSGYYWGYLLEHFNIPHLKQGPRSYFESVCVCVGGGGGGG